MEELVPE